MRKTVAFFETMGKVKLKADDIDRTWVAEFLGFVRSEGIFATLLTPPDSGAGGTRWDTWRIGAFSELLGFYGLCDWYTWQVSILGLGPLWMSGNEAMRGARGGSAGRGHLRVWPVGEGARRRRLLEGDDALAAGRRHVSGVGREVLHWQRQ